MADAMGVLLEMLAANWQFLLIMTLTLTSIIPWLALFGLNFFNHNIWQEMTATFDRKKIKLFLILQNGNGGMMYRKMTKERKILVKEDKKTGNHEFIEPSTPPIHDTNSHRQFYLAIEGVEGTFNPLLETNYDVNSPMRKMGHTLSFEAGRLFERLYNPRDSLFNLANLVQIAVPAILIIVLLILIINQAGTLEAIKASLASNTDILAQISEKIQTTFVLGAGNVTQNIPVNSAQNIPVG